jgi:hypothetical protein
VSLKVARFLEANAASPVVYGSVTDNGCTYRLATGQTFHLSRKECREIGVPRWAHLEQAA